MSTNAPTSTTVTQATLMTPLGVAHLFGTARGLLTIALPNERPEAAFALAERLVGPCALGGDAAWLAAVVTQLADYFDGTRRAFTAPLDLRGTPFQREVWLASMAIPYGETRTYGALAAALGRPAAARAVGAANAANPLAPIVPCHRLVGADGALRGHRSGLVTKRWLLDHERHHARLNTTTPRAEIVGERDEPAMGRRHRPEH